jgi:hypothetical protein
MKIRSAADGYLGSCKNLIYLLVLAFFLGDIAALHMVFVHIVVLPMQVMLDIYIVF